MGGFGVGFGTNRKSQRQAASLAIASPLLRGADSGASIACAGGKAGPCTASHPPQMLAAGSPLLRSRRRCCREAAQTAASCVRPDKCGSSSMRRATRWRAQPSQRHGGGAELWCLTHSLRARGCSWPSTGTPKAYPSCRQMRLVSPVTVGLAATTLLPRGLWPVPRTVTGAGAHANGAG